MKPGNATITVEPRPGGFAATVRGADLGEALSAADLEVIRGAWSAHGVLVLVEMAFDRREVEGVKCACLGRQIQLREDRLLRAPPQCHL